MLTRRASAFPRGDTAPGESDSWSVLGDVSQTTALVDDPIGPSTDNLWTYLKTDDK